VGPAKPKQAERAGVLSAFSALQPLNHLLMVHKVVCRQAVRLSDEDDAPLSANSDLIGATAYLSQPKAAMPVRIAILLGYPRELFFDFRYDLRSEFAG